MNIAKTVLAGSMAASLGVLSACANGLGANEYSRQDVGAVSRVDEGVVISSRLIKIEGQNGTTAGAAVGGAIGGLGGSQLGHGGAGTVAAGIGLGVLGAIVGAGAGKAATTQQGFAYTVQLKRNNEIVTVTQGGDVAIPNGAAVFIEYGPRTRIIPQDTGYKPADAPGAR